MRAGDPAASSKKVLERSGVIAEDRPFAHAECTAALDEDDVARFQGAGSLFDGLAPVFDAHVGASGEQGFD